MKVTHREGVHGMRVLGPSAAVFAPALARQTDADGAADVIIWTWTGPL